MTRLSPVNIYTILLFSFVLFACKQRERKEYQGISKVTVAFSGMGCENKCPFQSLSVDSSLNVYFYGGADANKEGYFTGKISHELWDSIQFNFNKFIVKGMDLTEHSKTDHPEVEFFVHDNFRKHRTRFHKNTGSIAEDDLKILYWFISVADKVSLTPTDSMAFESTFQLLYPPPPLFN